jgi:hypothetical protein
MAATNFPNSPSIGQRVTTDGVVREWNGVAWVSVGSTVVGPTGPTGPTGPAGQGVPTGGTTGQVLIKASNDDYDFIWSDTIDGGTP